MLTMANDKGSLATLKHMSPFFPGRGISPMHVQKACLRGYGLGLFKIFLFTRN